MMTMTQLAINLAEAKARLREAYQADQDDTFLVEHHLCSHAYTMAWWEEQAAYWHWKIASEKVEIAV